MTKFDLDLSKYTTEPSDLERPAMLMLYGPPGGGKTWLGASASEVEGLYPVLIIDTEGSTVGTLSDFDRERIDVIEPSKAFPGKEYDGTMQVLEALLTKSHKYKTVIIDTADVFAEWATAYGHEEGNAFAKWEFLHSELTAPPTRTKNGKVRDRGLFHRLKSDPNFLTILIVHDKEVQDSDGNDVGNTFQWQGQGKTKLGGIPDAVWYVTRNTKSNGDATTTIMTGPTNRSKTKNRFNALPHKMVDVRLTDVYALIDTNTKEDK